MQHAAERFLVVVFNHLPSAQFSSCLLLSSKKNTSSQRQKRVPFKQKETDNPDLQGGQWNHNWHKVHYTLAKVMRIIMDL